MTESHAVAGSTELLAVVVIVLYRCAPMESAAFVSLAALLQEGGFSSESIRCVLYDNGPTAQDVPAQSFVTTYYHDPTNPGLAAAYNLACKVAEQDGATWLVLLDQDTHLTAAYLQEARIEAERLRSAPEIIALTPKLLEGDLLLSPHWPPRHPSASPLRDRVGPVEPPLHLFNSGTWVRVAAVKAIGGFPGRFPLDFLDHALFTQLQRNGGRVYLLHAVLQHDLAILHCDLYREFGRSPRLESILSGESRFYDTYGTTRDRIIYALRRTRLLTRMLRAGNVSGALLLLRCTFRPG